MSNNLPTVMGQLTSRERFQPAVRLSWGAIEILKSVFYVLFGYCPCSLSMTKLCVHEILILQSRQRHGEKK